MTFLYKNCILLLFILITANTECPNPNLIIPNTFLDSIFDQGFNSINSQTQFKALITNPTAASLLAYFMSQGPYLFTVWAFGAVSLLLILAFMCQLCFFNCCGVRNCGKRINYNSYKPFGVTCSVYIFMAFSFLLIALSIATFILSSDLIKSATDTTCDISTVYDYLYEGSPQGLSPTWTGANNFNSFAQKLSINYPNTVPTINSVILSSPQYTAATQITANSLYNNSISPFNCATSLSSSTVSCPFSSAASCVDSSVSQTPSFSKNYCNSSNNGSAISLITNEQMNNSTKWFTNLINLKNQIQNSSSISFTTLIEKTSQLSSNFQDFKPHLDQAINVFDQNVYYAEIGTYSFLSFIILIAIVSFLSVCCVFCTRNYNCRFMLYPLWIIFALLSAIFFTAGGVLLFGSFTTFNACIVYEEFTTIPGNLQSLSSFNGSESLKILDSCFFSTSANANIFKLYQSQIDLQSLNNIQMFYNNSLPSTSFTTVATQIEDTLSGYSLNPNQVTLEGASGNQNPEAALNAANSFAANGGTSCNQINDTLEYNPTDCYPLLLNQSPPKPSCILINSMPNSVLNERQTALSNTGCDFTIYQNNLNALATFGTDVDNLVTSYLNQPGLPAYQSNYFNYYNAVSQLMNNYTQSLFTAFLTPYQQLIQGSSCSFITQSLNSLIDTSCNRDFPYIYAVTVLLISMAVVFFIMTILAYALTTRMQFYGFLKGDLSSYRDQQDKSEQIEMATMSNRQVLLKY